MRFFSGAAACIDLRLGDILFDAAMTAKSGENRQCESEGNFIYLNPGNKRHVTRRTGDAATMNHRTGQTGWTQGIRRALLLLTLGAVCLSTCPPIRASEPTSEQLEFFEKQVRPLLSERCYKCHSTRSEKLKGGLYLDSREGVMKGGEDGQILTPGDPGKSRLIEAINYGNPDLQMPPKSKLAGEQIAVLT